MRVSDLFPREGCCSGSPTPEEGAGWKWEADLGWTLLPQLWTELGLFQVAVVEPLLRSLVHFAQHEK